jgi:transposase
MALFPPVRGGGGGEGVDYGFKGKGNTIHQIYDNNGNPIMMLVTPASWSEQAQVHGMVRKIKTWTGHVPNELIGDRGYDSDKIRNTLKYIFDMQSDFDKRQYDSERRRQYRATGHSKKTERWKAERGFSWLYRRYDRTTQRKERLFNNFYGMIWAAFSLFWAEKIAKLKKLFMT